MRKFSQDTKITNEAAEELFKDEEKWIFVGETPCGEILWNTQTGELLFRINDSHWEMNKLLRSDGDE